MLITVPSTLANDHIAFKSAPRLVSRIDVTKGWCRFIIHLTFYCLETCDSDGSSNGTVTFGRHRLKGQHDTQFYSRMLVNMSCLWFQDSLNVLSVSQGTKTKLVINSISLEEGFSRWKQISLKAIDWLKTAYTLYISWVCTLTAKEIMCVDEKHNCVRSLKSIESWLKYDNIFENLPVYLLL